MSHEQVVIRLYTYCENVVPY